MKEEEKGLVKHEDVAPTPANLLMMAVSQGADLDKMERLMELQAKWEATEAKKAFTKAMTEFKSNPPDIIKDKGNKQYGSKYSSLENFVNAINPALSQHDLSSSWSIDQGKGQITVSCKITHILGHGESVSMDGPPDESGSKNELQKIKSTITYLKLSTLECITGMASRDANLNDDGNSAGVEFITKDQVVKVNEMIKKCGPDLDTARFLKWAGAETGVETIVQSKFVTVMNELKKMLSAKDK